MRGLLTAFSRQEERIKINVLRPEVIELITNNAKSYYPFSEHGFVVDPRPYF